MRHGHLMYRKPDGGQGYQPEEKERHEVFGGRAGGCRHMIGLDSGWQVSSYLTARIDIRLTDGIDAGPH